MHKNRKKRNDQNTYSCIKKWENSYINNAMPHTYNIHLTFLNTILKANQPLNIDNLFVTGLLLALQSG